MNRTPTPSRVGHSRRRLTRLLVGLTTALALAVTGVVGANLAYAAPATTAAPAWPLVRNGDTGDRVKTVQLLLRHHGESIDADGIFGPLTKGAVTRFQQDNGLGADGIVGPQTWPVLTVDLNTGSSGEAVKALQTLLNRHDHDVPVDGAFSSATQAALAEFKAEHGLAAGTAVNDTVWQYLVGASPPVGDASLPLDHDLLPRTEWDDPHHDYPAIDLAVPTGTPALAVVAGTASRINDSSCGLGVNIVDAAGNRYTYCHFSSIGVSNGQKVTPGQQIGRTGNTGNSTGPHLHFAIRKPPNTSVCPQRWLIAVYDGDPVPNPTTLPTTGCYY
ncbi:putative peptidoglycan binding protein [Stackebrandtia albiflava]|uniref:Putative peptidoglycan binding protein n=1 Tax=Stackebrandtia albiflava TaxID=406432 RepID=A0A562UQP1_9ACTN|nr:peptidoglycan-binding protein [Stackebrandtia albiflava]TWJ07942.1 putative peptidoglycan binding protein [Stackebrandtia albiflava]